MHITIPRRDPRIMRACLRPTADDLNGRVARGAAWMVTLVVVRTLLTLGATAILARLLTPVDYGYVAMATVVTEFGAMLCVFGLPAIIVRAQDLTRLDLDSGFWFSVALGVTIVSAIVAASSIIAHLFHEPRLTRILWAMSSMILFEEFSAIHQSIAYRLLLFRYEFIGQLANLLVRVATSLVLAFTGFGVWSLVWGSVAGRAAQFIVICYLIPYVPRLRFDLGFLRRHWRIGGSYFGSAAVTYVASSVDTATVGRMFGAAQLGYYQTAFALPEEMRTRLAMSMQRVLFPAFALVQSDHAAFQDGVLRSLRLLATIAMPMGIGMAVLAAPIVRTLYGDQWLPVVPLLQIVATIGIVRVLQGLLGNIYAVKGRPDLEFKIGLALAPFLLLAIAIGCRFGTAGVAAGVLAFNLALLVSTYRALRLIDLDPARALKALAPPAIATAIMGVGLVALDTTHALLFSSAVVALVVNVMLGALLFLAALCLISRQTVADMRAVWRHLRTRG
jgi:O-antigen/teichoic acid export membrane protein